MKAKFTVQDILDFYPCEEYTKERIQELFYSVGCKKTVTAKKICEADIPHVDFFWLILRPEFIPERQLHEIAIWCWEEIAQPIWEKHYPNDNRPQEAIRIKKLWLDKKATDKELAAARDAMRYAAGDTARTAVRYAAGDTARAAVWDTARDAMRYAAENAAWAAAWAAVRDAASYVAGDTARERIKSHVIEVINNI